MEDLSRMRLLVVGASSGIGRQVGLVAARRGARVAFAARSAALLEEAVEIAGEGCIALACDVADDDACERAVGQTARQLGGITTLVYAAASPAAGWFESCDSAFWERAFRTNVIGATVVVRAALPHLRASRGTVAFLSSESVDAPRPGMVAYGATKAALGHLADALRVEIPEVSFTRVVIGPTADTRLSSSLDPDFLRELFGVWKERGYDDSLWMDPAEVASAVVDAISSEVSVHETAVFARGLVR